MTPLSASAHALALTGARQGGISTYMYARLALTGARQGLTPQAKDTLNCKKEPCFCSFKIAEPTFRFAV